MPTDPLPYDPDQIGQLPDSGDPKPQANYFFRVIQALLDQALDAIAAMGTVTTADLDNDVNLTSNDALHVPTTAAIISYIALRLAGLLELKGNIDGSTNPNYPAGSVGDTYYVTVAGHVGGVLGKSIAIGDAVICKADNAGGLEATVGISWFVLERAAVNWSDITSTPTTRAGYGITDAAANGTNADITSLTALLTVYLNETSEPGTPAANIVALWIEDDNGLSRLRYKDDGGNVVTLARDALLLVKNTTGGTLSKGMPAYINGAASGVPTVAKAKADALATTIETGLILADIANNGFGFLLKQGKLSNFDTSGLTAAQPAWVSAATAGTLTSTQPVSPNFSQATCFCLTSHATTGSVNVFPRQALGDAATKNVGTAAGTVAAGDAIIAQGRFKSATETNLNVPGVVWAGAIITSGPGANSIRYFPVWVNRALTLDRISVEITTAAAAGKLIRLAIYNADADWQPTTLVLDCGTVPADPGTVPNIASITINQALPTGRYLLMLHTDGAPTLRGYRGSILGHGLLSTLGATPHASSFSIGSAYAVAASPGVVWDTTAGSASAIAYLVFVRVASFQ